MPSRFTHGRFTHSGVTLIETSVVSAIAAVIMSTVTPSFSGFIENRRIDGAATNLHADIQFVRQEAVLRNQPVRLSFYSADNSHSCYVAHTGNHADCSCDADGNATCTAPVQAIKTVAFSAGDKVVVQANVNSILFDPLHGTSTPTGTLKVMAPSGRAVHHVVNVMGRVRSCSPKGSASATATPTATPSATPSATPATAAVPGYRAC